MYPHPPFHVYFTKQQQKSSYYLGSAYLVHPGEWYENCQMATPLLLEFGLWSRHSFSTLGPLRLFKRRYKWYPKGNVFC